MVQGQGLESRVVQWVEHSNDIPFAIPIHSTKDPPETVQLYSPKAHNPTGPRLETLGPIRLCNPDSQKPCCSKPNRTTIRDQFPARGGSGTFVSKPQVTPRHQTFVFSTAFHGL